MLAAGVVVHEHNASSATEQDTPVLGFCNTEFLENLDGICSHSTNTVFASWL